MQNGHIGNNISYTMKKIRLLLSCVMFVLSCTCMHPQSMIKGNASYYSDMLHGRKMSNGERYDRDSMTCAHLKFPFGTLLRVRNPFNNKEVVVEVTDRGPYSRRFVLDLSRAAARKLGILRAGFMPVEISIYVPDKVPFLLQAKEDRMPELDLQYQIVALYPTPVWQQTDSIE